LAVCIQGTPLTPLFPATAALEPKELAAVLQMLKMRLTTFGPVLTKALKSGREQFNALQDFHRLCTRKGLFNAHANAGARCVPPPRFCHHPRCAVERIASTPPTGPCEPPHAPCSGLEREC
jgi:hypothetical protein